MVSWDVLPSVARALRGCAENIVTVVTIRRVAIAKIHSVRYVAV